MTRVFVRRMLGMALCVPLLSLTCLLPTGYAEPRNDWNLAARVPASTLAFASVEEVHLLGQRLASTSIGQFLADPAMQGFLAPIKEALEKAQASRDLPPELVDVTKQLESLRGQLALAFLGMSADGKTPLLVASLDFGPKVGEFAAFLTRMAAELATHDVRLDSTSTGGRTEWSLAIPHGPTLAATTVDTAFVVATDAQLLAQVTGGAAAGSLASSADFSGTLARFGGEGLALMVYGNVPAALTAFAGEWRGSSRRLGDALGLDTVKSVAYGCAIAGGSFRDTLLVSTPGADHGIPTMIGLSPIERPRFLPWVPANAFLYEEANLSLAQVLAAVRKVAGLVDEDAPADLDEGLAHVDRTLGVSLEKDVLAGLAGTLGWYASLPQGGGLYPEVALLATVKDPVAFEQVLVRLNDGIAGALNEEGDVLARPRTITYEGQKLHLMELQAAEGDDPVPFTPSWVLLGDTLVVTLVPYTLKEIVWRTQHAAEAGPGLESQADFRALWQSKPPRAGAVEYLDLQAVMTLLYDTGVPLLQTLVKPNVMGEFGRRVPLDWAELPPARVVRKHFGSMAGFTTWTRDGLEVRLDAPLPLMPVALGAMAAGFAMRSRMRSYESVRVSRPLEPEMPEMPEMPEELPEMEEPMDGAEQVLKAKADLLELMRWVRLHLLEQNALPDSLDDLVKSGWLKELPLDPWKRAYRFEVVDAAAKTFRVLSDGPDATRGTTDDVVVASR